MKKNFYSLHSFFRCVDSAIFFDFVEYILHSYNSEVFSFPPDEQLYLFSRFRLDTCI